MRLPTLRAAADVVSWAVRLIRELETVIGTREAAGISVVPVQLTTGTSTIVKATAARQRREVIPVGRNTSGTTAQVTALPITEDGRFTLIHSAGGSGRVVTCLIV